MPLLLLTRKRPLLLSSSPDSSSSALCFRLWDWNNFSWCFQIWQALSLAALIVVELENCVSFHDGHIWHPKTKQKNTISKGWYKTSLQSSFLLFEWHTCPTNLYIGLKRALEEIWSCPTVQPWVLLIPIKSSACGTQAGFHLCYSHLWDW